MYKFCSALLLSLEKDKVVRRIFPTNLTEMYPAVQSLKIFRNPSSDKNGRVDINLRIHSFMKKYIYIWHFRVV